MSAGKSVDMTKLKLNHVMGRENRFKNLQTRLNKQANLCKLQSYKFQITKQSCFKNLAKHSQNYPYQAQI